MSIRATAGQLELALLLHHFSISVPGHCTYSEKTVDSEELLARDQASLYLLSIDDDALVKRYRLFPHRRLQVYM